MGEKKTGDTTETYQRQGGAVNNDAFGKTHAGRVIPQFGFFGGAEKGGFARRL